MMAGVELKVEGDDEKESNNCRQRRLVAAEETSSTAGLRRTVHIGNWGECKVACR